MNGYDFSKEENVFISYFSTLHIKKANAQSCVTRYITKLLLNSLLGDFGLKDLKNKTELVNKEVVDELVISIQNDRPINHGKSYVYIPISAAINAYARMHMHKIKKLILDSRGEIYYTDKDSINTNIQEPSEWESSSGTGELKLRHIIKKGYFTNGKLNERSFL